MIEIVTNLFHIYSHFTPMREGKQSFHSGVRDIEIQVSLGVVAVQRRFPSLAVNEGDAFRSGVDVLTQQHPQ